MSNGLNINFVSLEQFNQLPKVNSLTSSQVMHGQQGKNLVSGKYWAEDSKYQTAQDPATLDPTYTTNAVDCTAGILIVSGANLHSDMMFHLNCHRNLEASSLEVGSVSHLQKDFPKQLEQFFGHLDGLIREGKFQGQAINIDLVLAGGLVDAYDKTTEAFTAEMIKNSPVLKDSITKMVEDRLAATQKLADEHKVNLHFSRSVFWGQQNLKPGDKGLTAFTNMHYDPSKHTLSLNARHGHSNPDKVAINSKGEKTWIIDHASDAVTKPALAEHYKEIQVAGSHVFNPATKTSPQ